MQKKKKYKNVYYKVICIYVIINILIIGYVQVIGKYAQQKIGEEYIDCMEVIFSSQVKSLETDLLYAKSIQDIILNDDRVKWLIYQSPIESVYKTYSNMQEVQELLTALKGSNPLIEDIGVYIQPRHEILSYQKGWVKEIEPININKIDKEKFITKKEESAYLISIPLAINGKYNSFSYIKINDRVIEQIINNIKSLLIGVEVGIIQNGIPIYTTDNFNKEKIEEILTRYKQVEKINKINDKESGYHLVKTQLISSKIEVIMYFDGSHIFMTIEKFKNSLELWIIISTIALGGFVIYSYYVINKPLKKLVELMNQIEKNNFNINIDYATNDQFEYIFKGFKQMISSLKIYIEKIYEQELELNKSELKQLQSQINPHFLYNCFFNISKMCKIEDSESAMELSQKLAKYYMFITRNSNESIRLEEEYEHTKLYLDIQTIRFGNRVNIQMDKVPEELKNIKVPRIILQPLVENCYKYVFEKIGEQGELRIHVEGELGGYLKISIEDNGNLIIDKDIEYLNKSLVENEKRKETTGLFNVSRRLKLRFGEESGLSVERGGLGGLKIQLLIILEEENNV